MLMTDSSKLNPSFVFDEIDEQVWQKELSSFVPDRIFDFHGHINLAEHAPIKEENRTNPSMPFVVEDYPIEAFADVEKTLWHGRETKVLLFGSIESHADLEPMNAYVSKSAHENGWEALMVPPIKDNADTLQAKIHGGGFIGFKPYWTFVTWKDQNDVTLEDMITPAMREAANKEGLLIETHIPRAGRLADPVNMEGIKRLCAESPNATILLSHFGRSYFPDAMGDGLSLNNIPNLVIDLSMMQDAEVLEAVFTNFDRKKIVFGLDLPFAQEKGKLISINGQRHFFTKRPHKWSAHVAPDGYEVRCTLFAYEIVRAIKKAATAAYLKDNEVEDIFWNNANRLVGEVKSRR
jgi:predicted TIM-barrel fold metal-dependent hydrolase